jgi:hypothetical protein
MDTVFVNILKYFIPPAVPPILGSYPKNSGHHNKKLCGVFVQGGRDGYSPVDGHSNIIYKKL